MPDTSDAVHLHSLVRVGKILNVIVTSNLTIRERPVVHEITSPGDHLPMLASCYHCTNKTFVKEVLSVVINGNVAVTVESILEPPVSADRDRNKLFVSRYTTNTSSATTYPQDSVHTLQTISDVSIIAGSAASNRIIKVENIKDIVIVSEPGPDRKPLIPPKKPKRGLFRTQATELENVRPCIDNEIPVKSSRCLSVVEKQHRFLKHSNTFPLYPTVVKVSSINKKDLTIKKCSSAESLPTFSRNNSSKSISITSRSTKVENSSLSTSLSTQKTSESKSSSNNFFRVYEQQGSVSSGTNCASRTDSDNNEANSLSKQMNKSLDSFKRESSNNTLKFKLPAEGKPPKTYHNLRKQLKRTISIKSPSSQFKPTLAFWASDRKPHHTNEKQVAVSTETMSEMKEISSPLLYTPLNLKRPSNLAQHFPKKSLSLPRNLSLKAKQYFSLRSNIVYSRPSLKLPVQISLNNENKKQTASTQPAILSELDVVYKFSERVNKNVKFDENGEFDPETSFVDLSCMPERSALAFTRDDSRFLDPALRDELKDLELFHDSGDDFMKEKPIGPAKDNGLSTSFNFANVERENLFQHSLTPNTSLHSDVTIVDSGCRKKQSHLSQPVRVGTENFPKLDIVYDREDSAFDRVDDECLTEYVLLSQSQNVLLRRRETQERLIKATEESSLFSHQTNILSPLHTCRGQLKKQFNAVNVSVSSSKDMMTKAYRKTKLIVGSIKVIKLSKINKSKEKRKNTAGEQNTQRGLIEHTNDDPNVEMMKEDSTESFTIQHMDVNDSKHNSMVYSTECGSIHSYESLNIVPSASTSTSSRLQQIANEIEEIYQRKTGPVGQSGCETLAFYHEQLLQRKITEESAIVESTSKHHNTVTEATPTFSSLLYKSGSEHSVNSLALRTSSDQKEKNERYFKCPTDRGCFYHTTLDLDELSDREHIVISIMEDESNLSSKSLSLSSFSLAVSDSKAQLEEKSLEKTFGEQSFEDLVPEERLLRDKSLAGRPQNLENVSIGGKSSHKVRPKQESEAPFINTKFYSMVGEPDKSVKSETTVYPESEVNKKNSDSFYFRPEKELRDSMKPEIKSSSFHPKLYTSPKEPNSSIKQQNILSKGDWADEPKKEKSKNKKKKEKKKKKKKRIRRVTTIRYVDEFGNHITSETKEWNKNLPPTLLPGKEEPATSNPTLPIHTDKEEGGITWHVDELGEEIKGNILEPKHDFQPSDKKSKRFRTVGPSEGVSLRKLECSGDRKLAAQSRNVLDNCLETPERLHNVVRSSKSDKYFMSERTRIASSDAEAYVDWKNNFRKTEVMEFPRYSGTWDSE